jgi:hypothetical protein
MTAFMSFWANLNAEMERRGEGEVMLEDARHLHKLFGDAADNAAEHEATLRREATAPIRSCVVTQA